MKIKPEVLKALEELSYSGLEAHIAGQLDRKLYVDVNKVLEACGGKWNRKAKAHLFTEDPEPIIAAVINDRAVRTAREDGFFPTPPTLAALLAADLDIGPGSRVLEPSAGSGALVRAAIVRGAKVVCVERDTARYHELCALGADVEVIDTNDFMSEFKLKGDISHVLMNPPFGRVGLGDHLDHVRKAWLLLQTNGPRGKLGAILPASVKFRTDRRHEEFRTWYERLGGTVEDLPDGSFRESGTMVRTVYLRVDRR